MSTVERGIAASLPEQAPARFPAINPDITAACVFAAVGILLAAYAAMTFPSVSEAWVWS